MALVAFYFQELIPPSDCGSSRPQSMGAEGKYLSAVKRTHAGKLTVCIQRKHEMNRPISVTLICAFDFHIKVKRHFNDYSYNHAIIKLTFSFDL